MPKFEVDLVGSKIYVAKTIIEADNEDEAMQKALDMSDELDWDPYFGIIDNIEIDGIVALGDEE